MCAVGVVVIVVVVVVVAVVVVFVVVVVIVVVVVVVVIGVVGVVAFLLVFAAVPKEVVGIVVCKERSLTNRLDPITKQRASRKTGIAHHRKSSS